MASSTTERAAMDTSIQALLKEFHHHLQAMETHRQEAAKIQAELAKRLPPDSPLLDWGRKQ